MEDGQHRHLYWYVVHIGMCSSREAVLTTLHKLQIHCSLHYATVCLILSPGTNLTRCFGSLIELGIYSSEDVHSACRGLRSW